MEHNDNLYISTADTKNVYGQMKKHPKIQIIALKKGHEVGFELVEKQKNV